MFIYITPKNIEHILYTAVYFERRTYATPKEWRAIQIEETKQDEARKQSTLDQIQTSIHPKPTQTSHSLPSTGHSITAICSLFVVTGGTSCADTFPQPIRLPLQHRISPTPASAEKSLDRPRSRRMVCNVGRSIVDWGIELVGVGVENGCQGLGIHCWECGGAGRRCIDLTGGRISGGKVGCVWFKLGRLFRQFV